MTVTANNSAPAVEAIDLTKIYGSGNTEGGFIGISGGVGEPQRVSIRSLSGSMDNLRAFATNLPCSRDEICAHMQYCSRSR